MLNLLNTNVVRSMSAPLLVCHSFFQCYFVFGKRALALKLSDWQPSRVRLLPAGDCGALLQVLIQGDVEHGLEGHGTCQDSGRSRGGAKSLRVEQDRLVRNQGGEGSQWLEVAIKCERAESDS